jgi:serine phosphatase RsbU (regulator of sigma subunit)/pSer/pThr/pTyr-binding forkhead associated (FHA) protein
MPLLKTLNGPDANQLVKFEQAKLVMGRHPDCDLVLDTAAVSRQHAQILHDGDHYWLEDLHSRNGTFVNGKQIQSRHPLIDGDRLKVGELLLAFFQDEASAATGSGTAPGLATINMTEESGDDNSTIMTKLDAVPSNAKARVGINAEAKLRAVLEISRSLAGSVSIDEVLPTLLATLFKIFAQADRAFVMLKEGPEGKLVPKGIKFRRETGNDSVRVSRTIVKQVMDSQEAVLSADASSDQRFDASNSVADLRIRSVMCAPLVNSEGDSFGVLQVDTFDQRMRFSKDDLDVLTSIASQAAVSIDNAGLHEQYLKKQAFDNDMRMAHKVQRGLLPSAPPAISGYQFFDFYEPALQVGGDYYDYIESASDRIAIVLGDVSGKGVSAALVMAKLSGEVRYCLASEMDPAEAVNRINESFGRSGWDDRFVTFVLVVLDPKSHEVAIVNAGHMPVMVRSASGVKLLADEEAGLPLGVDNEHRYQSVKYSIQAGEVICLYTDGISEAMNEKNELYGLERLQQQVAASHDGAVGLGKAILDDVKKFVGNHKQSDDMCIACLSRVPS